MVDAYRTCTRIEDFDQRFKVDNVSSWCQSFITSVYRGT